MLWQTQLFSAVCAISQLLHRHPPCCICSIWCSTHATQLPLSAPHYCTVLHYSFISPPSIKSFGISPKNSPLAFLKIPRGIPKFLDPWIFLEIRNVSKRWFSLKLYLLNWLFLRSLLTWGHPWRCVWLGHFSNLVHFDAGPALQFQVIWTWARVFHKRDEKKYKL